MYALIHAHRAAHGVELIRQLGIASSGDYNHRARMARP